MKALLKQLIGGGIILNYDLIVVGSGFSGATIAYCAAQEGKKVLVLERRSHIAGNMYDYYDEHGILVQKYGPHSFHTDKKEVYDFITSIGSWYEYILRARVEIEGKLTPSPFNLKTIDDFFEEAEAKQIKERLKMYYGDMKKTTIVDMLTSEDAVIKKYADFLFEKDYRPYTSKQWGIKPEELDISILKRVPVRLDYTDGYFDDKWQCMPEKGFTSFFETMLRNDNIDVKLNYDALEHIDLDENNKKIYLDKEPINIPIVYTGAIDEFFKHKYGILPYRSLKFEYKTLEKDSFQETSGVAYPMAEGYTRITEFKKIPAQNIPGKTTIAIEYPVEYGSKNGQEAYYPILTEESQRMHKLYMQEAEQYKNLYLCGRLADFKYYNMDDAILRAKDVYKDIF